MVPAAELFMSDVAKACSRSVKKRTTSGAGTHKNRTTDAIPNQKLGSSSFGALNGMLVCLTLPRLAQEA